MDVRTLLQPWRHSRESCQRSEGFAECPYRLLVLWFEQWVGILGLSVMVVVSTRRLEDYHNQRLQVS